MTRQIVKRPEQATSVFAKRILELRKERGWSQPELADKIGTSGKVIGRYELGYMTPSIEVARKFAEAFGVTVDYLITEQDIPVALKDRAMLARLRDLEDLPSEDKERVLHLVDLVISDAKAREAYKAS